MGKSSVLFGFVFLVAIGEVLAVKPMPSDDDAMVLQESMVELINSNPKAGWKAALPSRFSNYTIGRFKYMLGAKETPKDGHCGACWAFGAVECLNDRFCIQLGVKTSLSENDVLACCGSGCGDCHGGYPYTAWQYFVQNGVVTEECDPYFDPAGCPHPGCTEEWQAPQCAQKCKSENQVWSNTKHYAASTYGIPADPQSIMAEIYQNGPVQVSFTLYQDFVHYTSGVYNYVSGQSIGGHSVKVIGWGTSEGGEDYWLAANSWNSEWGDNGFFKIRRGTNECGFEGDVITGAPSSRNPNAGMFGRHG